jgi:hypothetical protein
VLTHLGFLSYIVCADMFRAHLVHFVRADTFKVYFVYIVCADTFRVHIVYIVCADTFRVSSPLVSRNATLSRSHDVKAPL